MIDDLVSIILPVYNGGRYLEQSIRSCLNQTYSNIELIIVNDCSTDNSAEIIESFRSENSRIKVLNNSINSQLPNSLNFGHELASGRYITWTSHDNIYDENAVDELIRHIAYTNVDIVYSHYRLIDHANNYIREKKQKTIENLLFQNTIGCSFLYKREVFTELKGYKANFFLVEDYDFWLRASQIFKFSVVPKYLYSYRIHDDSLTNQYLQGKRHEMAYTQNLRSVYSDFCTLNNSNPNLVEVLFKIHTNDNMFFDLLISNGSNLNILLCQMKNCYPSFDIDKIKQIIIDFSFDGLKSNFRGKSFLQKIRCMYHLVGFVNTFIGRKALKIHMMFLRRLFGHKIMLEVKTIKNIFN